MIKNFSWKKVLPHLIAIGVFLLIALIYGRQALSGQALQQGDVIHWKGMVQDAFNYKDAHGHFPLWNTHLFGGMPDYQIMMVPHQFLVDFTKIFTLGLPEPVSFFFLACICFYILTQAVGLRTIVGIFGSLAFGYATFNSLIIAAGHTSQMIAIAYMPAFLAGVILLYDKRYLIGIFTTTLFASCEIMSNHPQVNYYCMLCIGVMTVFYLIKWIKAGEIKHTVKALAFMIIAVLIAVCNTVYVLLPTYDYAKYTIRGGSTITIDKDGKASKAAQATTGLDKSYAFQYSLGKSEIFTTAMPDAFGSGSGNMFDENSDVYNNAMQVAQQLNGKVPPQQLQMVMQSLVSKYWGGIKPFTSGPFFLGTLIVLLAIVGFVVSESKHRWWIVTATALFMLIAWGGYFPAFNDFMFQYFPFFNKFRVPSMAMVIPEMLLPLMASIVVQEIFFENNSLAFVQKNFKKILYALGGFIVLALLVYLGNDYSLDDAEIKKFVMQFQGGNTLLASLESARKSMFLAGIGKVILFAFFITAGLFLYIKKIAKPFVIAILFLAINMFDVLNVDAKYLNSDNYTAAEDIDAPFTPTAADRQIMEDKSPHYRVLNLSSGDGPFNDAVTSYYHRSIGGYNAAKIGIYQNLIEAQFQNKLNPAVLNMLDTRYIIVPSQQGQQGQPAVQKNPDALGAAWFVKNINYVTDESVALNALTNFNPKDTAVIFQSDKSKTGSPVFDSTATITLKNYDNDAIQYVTDAKSPQFAVLSEIYYPAGWNAYIDGKPTNYVQADYVLRGISVPAGHHIIDFKFEPKSVATAQTLVYIGNILFWLIILLSLFLLWKQNASGQQIKEKHAV